MDLGFHLAMSYQDLKHPTSRKNFAAVVGQNHALVLTQCLMMIIAADFFFINHHLGMPLVQERIRRTRQNRFHFHNDDYDRDDDHLYIIGRFCLCVCHVFC